MKRVAAFTIACCLVCTLARGQTIATISLTTSPHAGGLAVPVSMDLDAVTHVADTSLALVEVRDGEKSPVPFQIRQGSPRTLHWIAGPANGASTYELTRRDGVRRSDAMTTAVEDGVLTIRSADQPLLGYQFQKMAAPDTVDPAYARSGFIHPLLSPGGHVLTRVQPPDHYHHYGIWNPWTHVEFEGGVVDFWNLAKREGTVRFSGFASMTHGPLFAEFQAVHEHVVLRGDDEEVALNELQTVRVYRPNEEGYFILDLTIEQSCAGESPVRLLEYRYGGLGWRGPAEWTNANSQMRTSEGHTRADADGSLARWLLVQGAVDGGMAGAAVMSYPTNYNHPEPLRVWPVDMYDRGDVFINFSPTKNKDWLLVPGERYVLRYRFLVFDGEFSAEMAEQAWQAYAHPPLVSVRMPAGASH